MQWNALYGYQSTPSDYMMPKNPATSSPNDPFSAQRVSDMVSSGGGQASGYGADSNPWLARLTALLDNPDSVQNSAAYKFRLGQGAKALERSAAARGMLGSGNTLAALQDYGQGMASQEYGNQLNALTGLYGTSEGANASRYGADTTARSNNLRSYLDAFKAVGSPGSYQRTNGLWTGTPYGTPSGGWGSF